MEINVLDCYDIIYVHFQTKYSELILVQSDLVGFPNALHVYFTVCTRRWQTNYVTIASLCTRKAELIGDGRAHG